MAMVRVEFREEVLVFTADDPIFSAGVCLVPACDRSASGGYGLCQGHHLRWNTAGRPDVDSFARLHRPAVAPAAAEHGVSDRRLRLRFLARWHVRHPCPAVAARRETRGGQVAHGRVTGQAACTWGGVSGVAL